MRHRRAGYRLGRTSTHRTAMLRNMAVSLFEHGQVVTTLPRAKALQPFVEKLITIAKDGGLSGPRSVAARRLLASRLGQDRKSFDWLYLPKDASDAEKEAVQKLRDQTTGFFDLPASEEVERNRYGDIRKAPKIVKHVMERVAPRFADRAGGYTRIIKLGRHRLGDAGELVLIQFVGNEEGPEIGGRSSTRRKTADKRTAYAAKLRKQKEETPAA